MKRISPSSLNAYSPATFTLIPLHRPNDVSTKHGRERKDGKRPLDFNWTVKQYDSKKVRERCIADNRNVGVRLKPDQLVIDVDPRNGGTDGFDNLCLELGLDPSAYPRVVTGSGGSHYYMTKPGDLPIVDTLEGFPGVEFKSRGRQVVAAGSIHPDTGKFYEWDADAPKLADMPEAPRALLNMIRRPQVSAMTGGGQASQAQIARALEALDVTDFREHDKWLRLMMACHHASNGDARSEWIEWSTQDPNYSNDAEIIGRRWDSLHREKKDGVTYKTLNKYLSDAGAPNKQIAAKASDDFDAVADDDADASESEDDSWLEAGASEESEPDDGVKPEGYSPQALGMLEALNKEYCTVVDGSKFKIVFKQFDSVLRRDFWVRMAPQDFIMRFANRRIERDKTGMSKNAADTIPLGKAWLEWPDRLDKRSVIFDPSGREHPEDMNLWTGFAYAPAPEGEWSYLREMIHEVLADGNDSVDAYIMNWLAFMFQYPAQRAEVAVVFRGGRGVGKGTLGNVCTRLIGRHAIAIASAELITGRFNAHLQDTIFLFADEAIKPYDKQAESRLKAFITEPLLAFEGKGRDPVQSVNYLHIMMASNENWIIPAGLDERRFLASDANAKWQGKFAKWDALHAQLRKNGDSGYKRLLFDLNKWPLPERWSPRLNIPTTAALIDQKIRSMAPLQQFLFNAVSERVLPCELIRGDWEKARVRLFAAHLRQAFIDWQRQNNINPGGMGRSNLRHFNQEIAELFPTAKTDLREPVPDEVVDVTRSPSDGRSATIELPTLAECRAHFERNLGGNPNWTGSKKAADEIDFG